MQLRRLIELSRACIAAKQAGHDLKFAEEHREHKDRKNQYDDNKKRAFAWMHETLCSKAMKSRLEEMSNFDSEIRDNPFKLLDATKDKMHDPARAKYAYASLTESMTRALLNTKQEFDEDLIDCAKRFEQAKDTFEQTVGDEILHKFVENTKDHKGLERAAAQSGGSSSVA